MFTAYPTYNRYRPLKLTDPIQRGEDVYALQTALVFRGFNLETDGLLGKATSAAIKTYQGNNFLTSDGIAGPATQSSLARNIAVTYSDDNDLPQGLLYGQLYHESGLILGNYSPQRADGSYDAGVAQRNTNHYAPQLGFDVHDSIALLANNQRLYYTKFVGVSTQRRRWELAAGAWNAPAYACWIAKQEGASGVRTSETKQPGATARQTLETYMDAATAFLVL